jgi:hypothetical protein
MPFFSAVASCQDSRDFRFELLRERNHGGCRYPPRLAEGVWRVGGQVYDGWLPTVAVVGPEVQVGSLVPDAVRASVASIQKLDPGTTRSTLTHMHSTLPPAIRALL